MIDLIDWLFLEIRFLDAERELFVDFFAFRQKVVAAQLSEEACNVCVVLQFWFLVAKHTFPKETALKRQLKQLRATESKAKFTS